MIDIEEPFKVLDKYLYEGGRKLGEPGDIILKSSPYFEKASGDTVNVKWLGELYEAVDEVLLDISNQWTPEVASKIPPEEFLKPIYDILEKRKYYEK